MWPFVSKQDVQQETTQLRNEFNQSIQSLQLALISEIRNIHIPLPPAQPPIPDVTPEIVQLSKRLFDLEMQVKVLVQIVQQLSATTASGTPKPIHEAIQAHINLALSAINALGNEHANWLDQHRVSHDEITLVIEQLQQKHQASAHHVFPPEKETEPIEQV